MQTDIFQPPVAESRQMCTTATQKNFSFTSRRYDPDDESSDDDFFDNDDMADIDWLPGESDDSSTSSSSEDEVEEEWVFDITSCYYLKVVFTSNYDFCTNFMNVN